MNHESDRRMRWTALLLPAVLLMAAGAGGAYLFLRRAASSPAPPSTWGPPSGGQQPSDAPGMARATPLPDIVVPLTEEAVARAGIEVATVGTSGAASRVRIPGTVQPNAYRSVAITPIVSGRVTRVGAELGEQVHRGQVLADIYSPELAEAQTRFLSSRAMLEAHERELLRTEKLVDIGAASRQELEKLHAEHTGATTMVESYRSRLTLLGMTDVEIATLSPASELSATVSVLSPLDGVITTRGANVGLNVDTTMSLFTVVDLSTVWVVGALYERDFAAVRVGSRATVTTTAYPGLRVEGRVSYIDPHIEEATRTAQVRVEVPNAKGELRFGMYAEMQVGDPRASVAVVVPRSAVQVVGDRSVVYLVNPRERGRFIEREVRLGEANGENVQVVSGVQTGDVVVSKGSFSIRAERERLGLR